MNSAEKTKEYINHHPSIKDCLKSGIINYSKLARKIAEELKITKESSIESILVASRRIERNLKDSSDSNEKKIRKLIRESELEVKNKIIVYTVPKNSLSIDDASREIRKNNGLFYVIEGSQVITLITSERFTEVVKKHLGKKIIKEKRGLTIVTLKTSKELEGTIGVMGYLFSLFKENGVNIYETMSCWTDTIFVIEKTDVGRVLDFLTI